MCDAGVVIDLRGMKHIEVDPKAKIARAAAGLNWGEVDAATQEHGLACTGGRAKCQTCKGKGKLSNNPLSG